MIEYSELILTNGTDVIDLLSLSTTTGLHLTSWTPASSRYKGGGRWHNSSLVDGTRPVYHTWDSTEEQMTFLVADWRLDGLAHQTADLRNMLQQAWEYFTSGWPQADPVYLIRRARGETNRSYSLVLGGEAPQDGEYIATETPHKTVSYDNWSIRIWREEHWRDVIPGDEGICVPAAGYEQVCWPCHVHLSAAARSVIEIPDHAQIQDLHDAAFTIEMWIRIDSMPRAWTVITNKGFFSNAGWTIRIYSAGAVEIRIACAVQDAVRWTADGTFPIGDGLWHHIAMTWDDAAMLRPRGWLDGVEMVYTVGQDRNGAVTSDVGENMYISHGGPYSMGFSGRVGWTRLSNNLRYAAGFTPTARCTIPVIDANIMGMWIGGECAEDDDATIRNLEGTAALDGEIQRVPMTGDVFDCDCVYYTGGQYDPVTGEVVPSCDEDDVDVTIRNAHGRARLTQIRRYDASVPVWSANLVNLDSFELLPNPAAAGDAMYFGIDNRADFYGPFFNLMFDLADNNADIQGQWEYWNGAAWVNLTNNLRDGTEDWYQTGICGVTWGDITDWTPNNPGVGNFGYWIRYVVTAIAVAADVPEQQNRRVYTTTWAFTELLGEDVPGDVPALTYYQLATTSEKNATASLLLPAGPSRVILGLRSQSRGEDFVPYFNTGPNSLPGALGAQCQTGVSAETRGAPAGIGSVVTTPMSSTGVVARGTSTAAAWQTVQVWWIDQFIAPQYYGKYRLFLRAKANSLAGTVRTRMRFTAANMRSYVTPEYTFLDTERWKLIDLGTISIPPWGPALESDILYVHVWFDIQQYCTNFGDTVDYYDAILMPIDEKVVESIISSTSVTSLYFAYSRVILDSISLLRTGAIRSLVMTSVGRIAARWQAISSGPAWIQANADQKLWMLTETWDYLALGGSGAWISPPITHLNMLVRRISRYRSLRGSR